MASVSVDPNALCRAVLDLMAAAQTADLPPIHAGIAWGTAVPSAGDWIGPVNLASRIVNVARPHRILIDEATRIRLNPELLSTEPAGAFTLKGLEGQRQLFRLCAPDSGENEPAAAAAQR